MKQIHSVDRKNGIAKSTRGLKTRLKLILFWATILAMLVMLFSFFSKKIFTTIDELYFSSDKENRLESSAVEPALTGPEEGRGTTKIGNREYTFSAEQIEQAKKEVLKENENPPAAGAVAASVNRAKSWVQSVGQKFGEGEMAYSIEMLSGGVLTCYNVVEKNGVIVFEDEKGLVVAIDKDQIKSVKRLAATE